MTEIVNAIHGFLSGVGIPVYPENGVPEDAVFPYMTFTPVQTDWDDDATMQVRIWDRSPNYIRVNQYADALYSALRRTGALHAGIGGYVTLFPGNPFAQAQPLQDTDIKVLHINLEVSTMII